MEYKVLQDSDYKQSKWTGGTTTQLAIFPEDSVYLNRDFVWRLSSATCEQDESTFSKLPDYDRVLIVLEGSVVLAHEDVRVANLAELEQDRFSGSYKTKSFGKITDYNLMVRKGNEGYAEVMELTAENQTLECRKAEGLPLATQAFYCRDGFATVGINGETVMVRPGQQLVINYLQKERLELSVMGQGHVVRCEIFYTHMEGDYGPVKIERKPATFADFKESVYIANTQFRFSQYIHKKLKKVWYDEELQKAIGKINQFYLADILYFFGFVGLAAIGANRFTGALPWVIAIAIWTVLYWALVAPLLYFLVLPKPVAAHIKDIDKLTPYEQKVRAEQLGRNERIERILGRYKMSGRMRYDADGNRIDDFGRK